MDALKCYLVDLKDNKKQDIYPFRNNVVFEVVKGGQIKEIFGLLAVKAVTKDVVLKFIVNRLSGNLLDNEEIMTLSVELLQKNPT